MVRKILGLAIGLVLASATTASAQYVCFPTCDVLDAKFLSLAGDGLRTFDSSVITVAFGVPSTATDFTFGVFDGENGGQWDSSDGNLNLTYTLYGDPKTDGSVLTQLGQWTEADFADDAWTEFTFANTAVSQAPSGNFFYRLSIEASNQDPLAWTNFRVRTSAGNSLSLNPQAFNFTGAIFATDDLFTIYPDFPNLTPTSYDGMWTFVVRLSRSAETLELWDGDLDHGDAFCTEFDTDDPDTPGDPFLPPWAATTAEFEGVASGESRECGTGTGAPLDDNDFVFFTRSPSVVYQVTDPLGNVYLNPNPSGNQEWERFALTTNPMVPADYLVSSLPAGLYQIQMEGMDLSNFNSWFIPVVVGLCDDGTACGPNPQPYLIGDFVWRDLDSDGVQDAGEPGIDGVVVELVDERGQVVATTTTAGGGLYRFEVEAGPWTVRVAASNSAPGGALDGLVNTSGATSLSNTVVDDNILTYDFGYKAPLGSLGDRVWLDGDGDGVQDAGEAGINGVTVRLFDGGGTEIATAVTAGDGNYTFAGLAAGNYSVRVDASTLPAGSTQTYDLDGLGTPNLAAASLAAGENRTDVDFGYQQGPALGSIGDRVWLDDDGDGVQDGGEPGINDVTVRLLDSNGNVIATTTTAGDGIYHFTGLAGGFYQVEVAASTVPGDLSATYDLDGLATLNRASLILGDGENRTDVDFGYIKCKGCYGLVTRLTMVYVGSASADIEVVANRGGHDVIVFMGTVSPGQSFEIVGPASGSSYYNGTLGEYVQVRSGGNVLATFDTSCKKAIGPGAVEGDFAVAAGSSSKGGLLCPVDGGGVQICAEESAVDPDYGFGHGGHALWLPNIDTTLAFDPASAELTLQGDGTAILTGTVWSTDHPTRGFDVTIQFANLSAVTPPGSPKKELDASAYVENGGPIDPSEWLYFLSWHGTLSGLGDYAGATIQFTRTGPAFQLGLGANGKNLEFGGSGWFDWTVTHQPNSGAALQTTGTGDVNIDFVDCKKKPSCQIKQKTPWVSSGSRVLNWTLSNESGDDLEISYIYIEWPWNNGALKKIRLGGSTTIWQGTDYADWAEITGGWYGGAGNRTLKPWDTKTMKFNFSNYAGTWADKYYMWVEFTNGCWVEWVKKD